jgi:hypothetical protein
MALKKNVTSNPGSGDGRMKFSHGTASVSAFMVFEKN